MVSPIRQTGLFRISILNSLHNLNRFPISSKPLSKAAAHQTQNDGRHPKGDWSSVDMVNLRDGRVLTIPHPVIGVSRKQRLHLLLVVLPAGSVLGSPAPVSLESP